MVFLRQNCIIEKLGSGEELDYRHCRVIECSVSAMRDESDLIMHTSSPEVVCANMCVANGFARYVVTEALENTELHLDSGQKQSQAV